MALEEPFHYWPLIASLETVVEEACIKKEHGFLVCFVLFICLFIFDLEKAYDTTWKHGIFRDLYELGF